MKRAVLNGHRLKRAVLNGHYVSSRAEAKARGLKFYFTGQPCRHGHLAERLVSTGACRECNGLAYVRWAESHPMRARFLHQRGQAKFRGIPFLLTFEEWRDWWLVEDRWSKRGCKRDQLVMARFGDEGPYSPENVYCATVIQNTAEANGGFLWRAEAKAQGLTYYTTGRPCRHGHVAERLVSDGTCYTCKHRAAKAAKAAKRDAAQLDAKPQPRMKQRSTRRTRRLSSPSLFW